MRDSLPKKWVVVTAQRDYPISTEYLRGQLAADKAGAAKEWMDHLEREFEGFNAQEAAAPTNARAELKKILSSEEYAAVRPPSEWELLRERIAAWITRQILKLFGGMQRYPTAGKFLFWGVVVGGVLFVGYWLFRFLASRERLEQLPESSVTFPTRSWQEWIRAAREAAGRGDFREAVHSTYWAGIVRLEDLGMVPKDRAKTPREYLRSLREPANEEGPKAGTVRESLAGLTERLERIWYANRGARQEDFSESLKQLEALGCPLE